MQKRSYEYFGTPTAAMVASRLIDMSAPFSVEPLPCDVFEFTVKEEYASIMPGENVARDALVEADDGRTVCNHCGRSWDTVGDDIYEGDPCPVHDCPSHDFE